MTTAQDLPLWAAITVSALIVFGAILALIGSIGFLRFRSFYERLHAPALAASWGTGAMVIASMLYFTVSGSRPVVHELLIGLFVTLTTPVTSMLLGRAALHRDRAEGNPGIPADPVPYPVLDDKAKGDIRNTAP